MYRRASFARVFARTRTRRWRSRRSRRTVPELYAALYRPPAGPRPERPALHTIAEAFSPRFEIPRDDLVTIDVSGLERLLGRPQTIGDELRRDAEARGLFVHVAVAGTRTS